MRGRILKNQNGYFSVADSSGTLQLCRSRGRLKRETDVLVGDVAEYEIPSGSDAQITKILSRKNRLYRPPVANIDTLVLVASAKTPDLSLYVLDKMLILAEDADISPMICINKCELAPDLAKETAAIYEKAGYTALCTSTVTGEGIEELKSLLSCGVIAFSGPSGVGKSSLLNLCLGRDTFAAGSVSEKTGRGKNTTRHAELIGCGDAFFMDTPGYTSLSLETVNPENLAFLFKEFRTYIGTCRFHNCRHINEPDCRVREAAEMGKISPSRYQSYLRMTEEIVKK